MNRLVAVLSTAVIILSIVYGLLFYQLNVVQSVNSELRSQNVEIRNQLDEVQTQNEELGNQITGLQRQNNELENISDELESQVGDKNSETDFLNSQVANLNNQISGLKIQVASLNGQITNLTSANLVTALGIAEIPYYSTSYPAQFSHLFIEGSVTNTGQGTAYNAGLHVVAYDTEGNLRINITAPLKRFTSREPDAAISNDSLQLGKLLTTQTADVYVNIFHHGVVRDWILIPVWTNSP
jgi:uncharacterized protein YoxC